MLHVHIVNLLGRQSVLVHVLLAADAHCRSSDQFIGHGKGFQHVVPLPEFEGKHVIAQHCLCISVNHSKVQMACPNPKDSLRCRRGHVNTNRAGMY